MTAPLLLCLAQLLLLFLLGGRDNAWTLDELCATFEAFGFEYERLSAEAATKRFPQVTMGKRGFDCPRSVRLC